MAFTYKWSVTSLKVKDEVNSEGATLPNAVVQTYWKVEGTDANGNTGEFSGATPFTAANVPAGSFVAFAELTEETVLGWIKNVVNNDPSYKEHIDGQIQKRIDQELTVEKGGDDLPWATPAVEDAEEVADPAPEETPEE
jgi:hypothetical protein